MRAVKSRPMRSVPGSENWSPGAQGLLEVVRMQHWPVTKAGFVRAMFHPGRPTFPLDAEDEAAVPDELPGPIPTSVDDLPL